MTRFGCTGWLWLSLSLSVQPALAQEASEPDLEEPPAPDDTPETEVADPPETESEVAAHGEAPNAIPEPSPPAVDHPAPAAAEPSPVAEPTQAPPVPPTEEYPKFEPSVRLMTGFERTSERRFGAQGELETERYGFFLSQARAQLRGELTKRIELELSAELADAYDAGVVATDSEPRYLRDAFMNLRLKRAFQVRLGHFKRPISALELRSSGKLQVRGRGLTNDLVIEDNAWGSRGLGLKLWGKLKAIKTRWEVGAFDPAWAANEAARPKGADLLARVGVEPVKGLTVSVNGGLKVLDTPPFDEYETYYAGGGDIELDVAGFSLLIDALYAQLPQKEAGLEQQSAAGVVGLASYDIPLTSALTLQPVLLGEYFDSSVEHRETETVRFVFGINWLVHERLRIMPQGEIVHWTDSANELSPTAGSALYVMVSLAF